MNNTVAYNGENDLGGGIIYDNINEDPPDAVNDPPVGVPGVLNIRNNICAFNDKAGIRACFTNTEGAEERNYNLVYSNFQWDHIHNWPNTPDCGWPDIDSLSCIQQQYGGCAAHFEYNPTRIVFEYPDDIVMDPLFKNVNNDDYRLQRISEGDANNSPAIDIENPGDDLTDRGAYGGSSPLNW